MNEGCISEDQKGEYRRLEERRNKVKQKKKKEEIKSILRRGEDSTKTRTYIIFFKRKKMKEKVSVTQSRKNKGWEAGAGRDGAIS